MKSLAFLSQRTAAVIVAATLNLSVLADQTWLGGSDNQWTTTANWSGAALPASTDQVIYNNLATGNLSNWLSQAFTIKGITVSNVSGPVSINSASTLTVPNGINMTNAAQSLTIAAPMALGASTMGPNLSWYVTNTGLLNVPGVVSGSGGLYKDGSGTLYLSGTNTFTGNFTNNGGAVWINNPASLGGGGSTKNITIANNSIGAGLHLNGTNGNIVFPNNFQFIASQNQGTVFNEAGNNVIPGNIYVTSGGGDAYFVVNAGTLTLSGPVATISGARNFQLGGAGNGTNNGAITSSGLAFRKMDAGTWTLTNNNTFTGTAIVEGGTLVLTATAKMGSTPSITVFTNATLDVSAVITSGTNAFALSANQILAGGGTVNGNVNASAAGAVIQPGSLNVHNSAGGTGTAGTLSISGNLAMGPATTNYFELSLSTAVGGGINDLISVGGNLDPQGAYVSIGTLNGLADGTYRLFTYAGAKLSSFNPICLSQGLRGTLTIDESVTNQINLIVSGVVNPVWAGTGSSSTWDFNTTADWNTNTLTFFNGDSVTFDDTGTASTVNISGTLQPGSVTFNDSAVNYTLAVPSSGKLTGPSGLTKSGSGTLTITANTSDFTGPVTINGGTLSVNSVALNGSASTLGAGTSVVLNGGTFQAPATNVAAAIFSRSFVLGASGGTISVGASGYLFVTNTISGPGSLTKLGASKQLIIGNASPVAGVNTYTGNTYINQGELQIRNANALGTGKVVINAGGDLAVGGSANYGTMPNDIDLNGVNGSDNNGYGALRIGDTGSGMTFAGTITLLSNSSVGSQSTASGLTFNITGPIVGSGSFTKMQLSTAGLTCTLGGTNTYTGNTIVSGGTLAVGIGGVGSISNTPSISVAAGAKLQLNAGASLGSTVNISLPAGGYFDVNGLGAGSTYTLGSGATLNAAGTGTASGTTQAEIHGNATGTVNLGASPISLTFTPTTFTGDTTHPPLVISQGALQLNGNEITINNAAGTALGAGAYQVIRVGNGTSGSLSGTPNATPFITGKGLASGMTASLSVSSGNVILTVASTSPAATTTTLNSLSGSSYGSSVTFTATVSPDPTSGTVQFYDNGVAVGSPVAVSGGTASFTTSALWAGSHPITAAYSGASGYAPSVTASASSQVVSAGPLTITANSDSKTYGQAKAYGKGSTAFTVSGLQGGDTITSVTLTSSGAAGTAAVGSYNLTPSAAVGGAFNANNYAVTYNNGTLTVNPAPLSITASADSKTYGQTKTYGPGSTAFTSAGLQNGEAIGSVTLSSAGAAATAAVGPYSVTPSAAVGGTFTASNYTITYNPGTLTVNAAALSITANADSKTYGQTKTYGAGSTAFTSSGLQNGENIGSVTLTDGGNGGLATAAVGSYTLTSSAATGGSFTASNYTITYHSGTLTVGAAALDITANNATKECSQTLTFAGTEFTPGAGQLVNGDTVTSVTLTSSGSASGAATGPYSIVPSAAVGTGLGNYNIAYHNGTLTVSDTTPPAIVYYFTNLTLSATSTNCQGLLPDLTGTNYIIAMDSCSSSVTVTQNPPADTWLPLGTNVVVLSAFDASGNTTNSTNTVVVADTTPPVVIYSFSSLSLSTTSTNCQAVLPDLTGTNYFIAADGCSGAVTVTQDPPADTLLPLGTNQVVLSAFDSLGNTTNLTNTVIVADTTAPVITLLGANPLTNECHSPFTDPGAIALDNCAGAVAVTASGTVNPDATGIYTIQYMASDPSGNTATNTRTVYVVDTTPPVITLNGANPMMVECHGSFTDPGASATDACAGPVAVTVSGSVDPNTPGTYTLTYSATDGQNASQLSRTVTVQDTTPPVVVYAFTNLTLSTTATNCQALLPDLTGTNYIIAVDACSPSVTVTQNPPANTWLAVGTNQVVLTALDSSGNTANSTNAVIVADTTPPAISCPADISVVTTDPGAAVSFTVTATDNCDPSPTVWSDPASGSFFPAGTNTVIAYATDSSGNSNTCSFLVMVDRAPVVQTNVTASTLENQLLALDIASLLAVVSDPDNDPLAVTAAGPTSTNGGTVTLTSTNVTYLPVANYMGADLFSYVVSDGRGGFATNAVLVSVLSSAGLSPSVVFGPVVSNGLFIVRFAGIPGYTYTVEATDDLGSPSWTKKANLTAPVTDQGFGAGVFEFSESVGAATSRYYRTVYPSY